MKSPALSSQSDITQLGEIARACLTSGQHGKVLAVFSKAIYLLTDSNELFWITNNDAPMHRRTAQSSTPLPEPLPGSPFDIENHRLIIHSFSAFELSGADAWRAPRLDPRDVLEISKLPARVTAFFSGLNMSRAKGFGTLIPQVLSLTRNGYISPLPQSADPILAVAGPVVLDMARACFDHEASRIAPDADALIGLGTGLTPSGDDFLGGLSFAINSIQTVYPGLGFGKYKIPIKSYGSRTHLISFTLLNDLANGHAIAPLHEIINGLFRGKPFESLYPFVSELISVGHSTGWDLLTGLLTGLLTTFQAPLLQGSHIS